MKSLKALLLILDQWGLHEIKIQKCLKTLLVILDECGAHEIEIHQTNASSLAAWYVITRDFMKCLKSLPWNPEYLFFFPFIVSI